MPTDPAFSAPQFSVCGWVTELVGSTAALQECQAYPAVRTRDVPSAHLLHADCGERLRYAKHCPVHGAVDNAAIVRGYEYGPGQHVLVEPDALDELRPAQDKALRLERRARRR